MSLIEAHREVAVGQRGFEPVDGPIGDLSARAARRRFAFADAPDDLRSADRDGPVASIGISPTGPPHAGTLGQLHTAAALASAGVAVQVVLADLVVLATGRIERDALAVRTRRYAALAREVGIGTDRGRIVVQSEAPEVLATGFRLAREYEPGGTDAGEFDDLTRFERALSDAYDRRGERADASPFAGDLAGLQLAADTIHPLLAESAERVVLVLGADNVGMARWIDAVRESCGIDGTVTGLYTHLVAGVDGTPKMSKSLPGSGLHLGMALRRIREIVRAAGTGPARPADTDAFRMMALASPFGSARLRTLEKLGTIGDERWVAALDEYADYMVELAERWDEGTTA